MTRKKNANHRGRRKDQFELPAQVRSWRVTAARMRLPRRQCGEEQTRPNNPLTSQVDSMQTTFPLWNSGAWVTCRSPICLRSTPIGSSRLRAKHALLIFPGLPNPRLDRFAITSFSLSQFCGTCDQGIRTGRVELIPENARRGRAD